VKHLSISFDYGRSEISIPVSGETIEPYIIDIQDIPAILNAKEAFREACLHPIEALPLTKIVQPDDKVLIVTSDGTRPVPNHLLIPWLLEVLPCPKENITILLGNGSHRANTSEEIIQMFGKTISDNLRIVNHDAFNEHQNRKIGKTKCGIHTGINKRYMEADKRIILGFIEPHFFAGFSGGGKALFPGTADIHTIMNLHKTCLIDHPKSTWGEMEENPVQQLIDEMVSFQPPDFLINVALNAHKQIAQFFCGHFRIAHQKGCQYVKQHAMRKVKKAFPIVVTSNSGFPLDQNLYQTVKGISAAARITEPGGTIIMTSQCLDGIPNHGQFFQILQSGRTPEQIMNWIYSQKETVLDQWQVQILVKILFRVNVLMYTEMDKETLSACHIKKIEHISETLFQLTENAQTKVPVAFMPRGPLTISYIED